jgi:hypothetical protein
VAPAAVSTVEFPLHIVALLAVSVGVVFTVIVLFALDEQFPVNPVTV